jgi:hypothetical protein
VVRFPLSHPHFKIHWLIWANVNNTLEAKNITFKV